jgi:tryptophanyl-tRNA synthetase
MGAVTGGRPTLEEQKAMGGEADRCPVYLLNLFHLIEDDRELQELRDRCCGGELTCGACKKETFARVSEFLHDFSERMDAVEHLVEV